MALKIAALNSDTTGTAPRPGSRLLDVGVNILTNERIARTEGGQGQMLFIDESAYAVGRCVHPTLGPRGDGDAQIYT
jgi:hypothetical protein